MHQNKESCPHHREVATRGIFWEKRCSHAAACVGTWARGEMGVPVFCVIRVDDDETATSDDTPLAGETM